jgi:hypothetical protein
MLTSSWASALASAAFLVRGAMVVSVVMRWQQ